MTELTVGAKAPLFSLLNQEGKQVSLSDFRGKWLVLYFYPKDDTPGCTIEAIDFTKYVAEFQKLGATIIGVSPDTGKSHCKFQEKHTLKVELLSDESKIMMESMECGARKNSWEENIWELCVLRFSLILKERLLISGRTLKSMGMWKKCWRR